MEFASTYLKPRVELRTGNLCKGKAFGKKAKSRFSGMFDDDDDDEGDQPIDMFNRDDDYGGGFEDQRTNQTDMDNLMKPCLIFNDDDEEADDTGRLLSSTIAS
jgi:hypothetical protein